MYADLTYKNKSVIKRHSHSRRIEISRELITTFHCKRILDYGSGDGMIFLGDYDRFFYAEKICLFEPFLFEELLINIKKLGEGRCFEVDRRLPSEKFDMVTCFEVLEHFEDKPLLDRITEIKSIMTKDGVLIISVPIETGISGLLKNLIRIFLRQTHPDTTLKNIIKAVIGLKISRKSDSLGYIDSHIGFNYKTLEAQLIKSGFSIVDSHTSPSRLPILRNFASQKFLVCKR